MREVVAAKTGEKSLLDWLREQKIYITAPCDGTGACGKCRVRFLSQAPVPSKKEQRILTPEELAAGVRLACAVHTTKACRILLEDAAEEEMAVLTKVQEGERGKQPDAGKEEYGIAVDIGTTTLAAELFALSDGRTLATASGVNHQRAFGADVLARINAANTGKRGLLQQYIRTDIAHLLQELLGERGLYGQVKEIVLVGNTTMCHLLRGLSCAGLGQAPFLPADNSLYETETGSIPGMEGLCARVTILPGISAFVGADVVAGICACGMIEKEDTALFLDIGTNSEMVVWHAGELLVTSAAAGPVFEGGNITCGTAGISGAVSHAYFNGRTWKLETIGGKKPVGICGSGILDIVSELLAHGWVDENGTLKEPWFTQGVALAGAVSFLQGDIREVQMGKAAIRAGLETLLAECGACSPAVYLAGGFGTYMDLACAMRIGMFPESFKGRINRIGNAALEGAKQYVLSEEKRRSALWITQQARNINLAEQPLFQEWYIPQMCFEKAEEKERRLDK